MENSESPISFPSSSDFQCNVDSSDCITLSTVNSQKVTTSLQFEITTARKHIVNDSISVKIGLGYMGKTLDGDRYSKNDVEFLSVNYMEVGQNISIQDVIENSYVLLRKESMMSDPQYKIDYSIDDENHFTNISYNTELKFVIPISLFEKSSGVLCFSFSYLPILADGKYNFENANCKFLKLSYAMSNNELEFEKYYAI